MTWRIAGVQDVDTSAGRDTVSAALVTIESLGEKRGVLVELSRTAGASGQSLDARDAVRAYLNDDDPPTHLIVTTGGVQPAD